jgi:acyl carrier protein
MSSTITAQLMPILQQKCPNIDLSTLTMDEALRSLGIDSLDFLELIYPIETHFGIELPMEDLETTQTLRSLIAAIDAQIRS